MATNMREMTKDALQGGFDLIVHHLYSEYFKAVVLAHGDKSKLKMANEQFKSGIAIAKQSLTDCLNLSN
jgi:hypothetical protein